MALFLLKPVIWNTNGYTKPSGVKVSKKSYPGIHGYGHEEWNNADCMRIVERKAGYRVFHTEGLKRAPTNENAGQTFVFMTASNSGKQMLVGVAGNATYLGDDEDKSERLRLVGKLKLGHLWKDAWELPRVKSINNYDEKNFQKIWKSGAGWMPNWISPEETFWWPKEPVVLNPTFITGKAALPMMFGAHQIIDTSVAERIMQSVEPNNRDQGWMRLTNAMHIAPQDPIDTALLRRSTSTQTIAITTARLGQGRYRFDLEAIWGAKCSVTDISQSEALRASHILCWKESSDDQRLDPNNGLLLCGTLDALFDKGLISFEDNGAMLVSKMISKQDQRLMDIPQSIRLPLNPSQKQYLKIHRDKYGYPL